MKQIVSNYSYSPTTNVVTLTGVNIDADQLLLIVAPQVGRTMYNFASVTGSVVAGADTRVALNASTAGLTTTSPLVIFYDDQAAAQSVTGTVALDPASLIALENVTVTVGSSVSISNFPSTQTIAGTVTANIGSVLGFNEIYLADADNDNKFSSSNPFPVSGTVTANVGGIASGVTVPVRLFAEQISGPLSGQDTLLVCDSGGQLAVSLLSSGQTNAVQYDGINSFVNVKNISSVTIGSLPAISGTVTANVFGTGYNNVAYSIPVEPEGGNAVTRGLSIGFHENVLADEFRTVKANEPFPVQVRAGSVTIGSLPAISGTVTVGAVPNGSLTTRFGTPTTANTAFATSAVTNASRKYLLIQNVTTGSNVITVGIGFTPTTTQGIQLTAGAGITFESSYIPTGAVYVLSSVTASAFTVLEA